MGAWEFFFVLVPLAIGILVSGSYAVIALTPADFRLARRLAWVAAFLGIVLIVGFGFRTDLNAWIRIPLIAALGIVVAVSLTEGLRWITNREAATIQANPISPELQADLKEIDGFLSRKDENELREEFDIPHMLELNIRFVRRDLMHRNIPKEESEKIDEAFKGGQGILGVKYANLRVINNAVNVEWIPGKVGVINTTPKYIEAKKRLSYLIESVNLPTAIIQELKELDTATSNDMEAMIDSLNESIAKDRNNIVMNFDYGSPFYGSASGLYWAKFKSLRPVVDHVNAASLSG